MKNLFEKTRKFSLLLILSGSLACLPLSVSATTLASADTTVNGIADFEDLGLAPETDWHGTQNGDTVIRSGSYSFTNTYTPDWDSWMGFAFANISDSTYVPDLGYGNQYKNAVGGGALGSSAYGVVYDHGVVDLLEAGEEGAEIPGCYVTNNIMLYNAAVNGDTYSGGPFESGDYFKVFFRGIRPDGDTAVIEYYLADCRDADSAEHYILNSWEWVDLSGLGAVSQLLIGFEGSRVNQYGPLLPSYMAIDKIGVVRPESRVIEDSLLIGDDALLAFEDVFSLPGTGRWDVVAGEPDAEGVASVSVGEEGLQDTENKMIHIGKPIEFNEENFRQKFPYLPGISLVRHELVKFVQHSSVKIFRPDIDREHSRSVSASQHSASGQLPVDVTRQSRKKPHFRNMLFSV